MSVLRRLLGRRPIAPPGPIYAVGDIHGRADLLRSMIDVIARDAEDLGAGPPEIILLGDYVDRGPDSRGVVDLILALSADHRTRVMALKGNHEDTLLRFIRDPSIGPAWMTYGGRATLRSYGVSPPRILESPREWTQTARRFASAIPAAHRVFFDGLSLFAERGEHLFVHAGIRPGVALHRQKAADLLWIRDDFLSHEGRHAHRIVHGHTITANPFVSETRICVDTGAYRSGRLTAVRIVGADHKLIEAVAR